MDRKGVVVGQVGLQVAERICSVGSRSLAVCDGNPPGPNDPMPAAASVAKGPSSKASAAPSKSVASMHGRRLHNASRTVGPMLDQIRGARKGAGRNR